MIFLIEVLILLAFIRFFINAISKYHHILLTELINPNILILIVDNLGFYWSLFNHFKERSFLGYFTYKSKNLKQCILIK